MWYDRQSLRQLRRSVATVFRLGSAVGLIYGFGLSFTAAAELWNELGSQPSAVRSYGDRSNAAQKMPLPQVNAWAALSELNRDELAAYRTVNEVQRVPFDSVVATIRTCLRGSEDAIASCLDAGSGTQACETDSAQCAYAAEQAWQLYIEHYLRLLRKRGAAATPDASQAAWAAYVREQCDFESALPVNDIPLQHIVDGTCRAGKAQARALELRSSLIDANN